MPPLCAGNMGFRLLRAPELPQRLFKTGDTIRVDGESGVVTIFRESLIIRRGSRVQGSEVKG